MKLEDVTFKVYTSSVFGSIYSPSAEVHTSFFAKNGFVNFLGAVNDGSGCIFRASSFHDRVVRDQKSQRDWR